MYASVGIGGDSAPGTMTAARERRHGTLTLGTTEHHS